MDRSENYMNVKMGTTDSRSASRAEPDVSYAEVNFKTLPAPRNQTNRDGLNTAYSELNIRKEEHLIDENEDPPFSLGPGRLPTKEQTAAQERESKVKIGMRPYRLICLLCLVTFALIVTVAGLLIHVSQIRQSKITSERNYHEINSTLQSKLSALNSNLSDLRHQFTEMETKYRSVKETKAQICELLTSRREQTCSQDWIRNGISCYFISTFKRSYDGAMQYCSKSDAKLLEINSREEENFADIAVPDADSPYWIGACRSREVSSDVAYKMNPGKSECTECKAGLFKNCKNVQHRFICEKPAPLFPDIPEKIRDLCQKPVEPAII